MNINGFFAKDNGEPSVLALQDGILVHHNGDERESLVEKTERKRAEAVEKERLKRFKLQQIVGDWIAEAQEFWAR